MSRSIKEEIQYCLDQGWLVTPLRGKEPFLKDWQNRAQVDAEVTAALAHPGNFGVRLGEVSGNLIDVDFDCDQAARAAPYFLPPTPARFGRQSRPTGHYLYVVDTLGKNESYKSSDKSTLVEFRGNGLQTMMPGSVHPNGEEITWVESGPPAQVTFAELQPMVARLAAAAEVARHWPTGSRHDCALALSSVLLRSGWTPTDVQTFVQGVCAGAQDEDVQDRLGAVHSSEQRIDDDLPATGLPKLVELLSKGCVSKFCALLGIGKPQPGKTTAPPFSHDEHGMYMWRSTKTGIVREQITNFSARIRSQVWTDDGNSKRLDFQIEARVHGKAFDIEVPADEFDSMDWVTVRLGAQAYIFPRCRDEARAATKFFSAECTSESRYGHTGWSKIDGEWYYLHSDGAIGAHGNRRDIKCRLPGCLAPVVLEVDESKLLDDFAAFQRLRRLEPHGVVRPLQALAFRTAVEHSGQNAMTEGRTGTFKTAVAVLIQQFFGASFSPTRLPASFNGTANSLESIAYTAKDMVLVIDDYCPNTNVFESQRAEGPLDRLCRSNTEGAGRSRGTREGGLLEGKPPRCTIFVTSESLPSKASLRARAQILPQGDGVTDLELLTKCQQDGANGCYSRIMASFIMYIAGRRDEVRVRLAKREIEFRAKSASKGHPRAAEMEAKLVAGMEVLVEFLSEKGLVSALEGQELMKELEQELADWKGSQVALVSDSDPVDLVLRGIRQALASGRAHVSSKAGARPAVDDTLCASLGWRSSGGDLALYLTWNPGGARIGTLDGDELVLFHGPAIEAARAALGSESSALPDSRRFLSELDRQGWITRREEKRGEKTVRSSVAGIRTTGVQISLSKFLAHGDGPEQEAA